MDSMIKAASFKKTIVFDCCRVMHARLQSANLVHVCLEKLQNVPVEISGKVKIADPYVLKLVKDVNGSYLQDKQSIKENMTIKELKLHLLDSDILPLSVVGKGKFETFQKIITEQSNPVMLSELDLPRVPTGPIRDHEIYTRRVSFRSENDEKGAGFLTGVKDALFGLIGKREDSKKWGTRNSSSNIDIEFSPEVRPVSGGEDDYLLAMMKENARLRGQVLRMRNDQAAESGVENKKKSTLDGNYEQMRAASHKPVASGLVGDPASISESSDSFNESTDRHNRKIAKATSLAAAIAASVTAQITSKPKRSRRKDLYNGALVANSLPSKTYLNNGESLNRGSGATTRQSSADNITATRKAEQFAKPNLFQMKQENDRLAKALGQF